MQLAIDQARLGLGSTSPNPAVGAVVVKNGFLLGKGYHKKAGLPHAEREAFADVMANHGEQALCGATIFITLEPCSTTGRTPACTSGIIEYGITHVVYGATDPNPAHAGKADRVLSEAGITVTSGVLEEECMELIRSFSKRITQGIPWVIAKTAMSLDGKITRPPAESQWLTSPESRMRVHQLRSEVDAIIIGGETVRKDNPALTVRDVQTSEYHQQPYRVVLARDKSGLPVDSQIFTDAYASRTKIFENVPLLHVLKSLAELGCSSVMLECGGGLMGQWFDQSLVDECYFFIAPILCGGDKLAVGGLGCESNQSSIHLTNVQYETIGNDVLAVGCIQKDSEVPLQ